MKLTSKLNLAVASVLFLVLGPAARANVYYEYEFEPSLDSLYANAYSPIPNRDYIIIDATTDQLAGWYLTDGTFTLSSALTGSTGNSAPGVVAPETHFFYADASGFFGYIAITGFTSGGGFADFFSFNGVPSFEDPGDAANAQMLHYGPSYSYQDSTTYGNWVPNSSVPDAANTVQLLLAAMGVLGICRRMALQHVNR